MSQHNGSFAPYPHPTPEGRPPRSTARLIQTILLWTAVAFTALIVLGALIAGHYGVALLTLGMLGLIIGIVALTVGHFNRVGIRTRKQAAAATAASLALFLGGPMVMPQATPAVDAAPGNATASPTPTPVVTMTVTATATATESAPETSAAPEPTPTPEATSASPTPSSTPVLAAPAPTPTAAPTTSAPVAVAPPVKSTPRATRSAAPLAQPAPVEQPTRSAVAAPKKTLAPAPRPAPTRTATAAPKPAPLVGGAGTDPRHRTCKAAKAAGLGPYIRGVHPEYNWYKDADSDGIVCE